MNIFDTDSHEGHVVREFIEAHWHSIAAHCDSYADRNQTGEELAENIHSDLGGD